jgi:hypothetical protein
MINVTASELRKGDLLRMGVSENYVLVAGTTTRNGKIHVTICNGSVANDYPTFAYEPIEPLQLSRRDLPVYL